MYANTAIKILKKDTFWASYFYWDVSLPKIDLNTSACTLRSKPKIIFTNSL